MPSRQQRIRRCRDSARAWVRPGAKVTVHSYAKRIDVDRYSAYADLTAIGVTLPASAQRWAQRPSSNTWRTASDDDGSVECSWIMLDGRRFFVADFTSGGAPYGGLEDERESRGQGADDDSPF